MNCGEFCVLVPGVVYTGVFFAHDRRSDSIDMSIIGDSE
jgi:hypothetical protein